MRSPAGVCVKPGARSISPARRARSRDGWSGKWRQDNSSCSKRASQFINSTLTPDNCCRRRSYWAKGACNTKPTRKLRCWSSHSRWAVSSCTAGTEGTGAANVIKGKHRQPITIKQRKRFMHILINKETPLQAMAAPEKYY
ncbi:hypothetical protein D3C85_762170 [compost metagenome]